MNQNRDDRMSEAVDQKAFEPVIRDNLSPEGAPLARFLDRVFLGQDFQDGQDVSYWSSYPGNPVHPA